MQDRNWEEIAYSLNYELRNYEGLKKQIVQIMNRAHSYEKNPWDETLLYGEHDSKGKIKFQGLTQLKEKQSRRLMKIVKDWPIWDDWLSKVPGIGPFIAAKLIRLYYFKFIPICQNCGADLDDEFKCIQCGKEAKGEGNLKHRVELRDFPTISSWWHFMGRHIVNGKIPKRKAGAPSDWSSAGRNVGFDIRETFNRMPKNHKYREFAEKRKRYREGTHPKATKIHRHNMAWNEAIKLFLSHFWQVARTLDGLPLTEPWCVQHGGHDPNGQIPPFYWNGN